MNSEIINALNIRCLFSVLVNLAHFVRACNFKFPLLQSSFICFTFEKHINELCKKWNLRLHALTRCAKIMSTEKRHLIFTINRNAKKFFIRTITKLFLLEFFFYYRTFNINGFCIKRRSINDVLRHLL